jgi:DNA-binding NarL/FixJ family response regulator
VTITVVVADDQHLVRAGLSGILDLADDITVVGEASDGREAVSVVRDVRPDVVLMDVRMPEMDGLEATRIIVQDTDARVVVLTTFDLDEYVFTALVAGASGFLLKDTPAAQLQEAVRVVASGEALLSPSVTRTVIDRLAREDAVRRPPAPSTVDPRLTGLTPREAEILGLVARGQSNAEIATQLTITPGTVKTHVSHLLTKLDARDRIQLVILAHTAQPGDGSVGDAQQGQRVGHGDPLSKE